MKLFLLFFTSSSFLFCYDNILIYATGAALGAVPQGDDPTKWDFAGSTVVLVAESVEEVRAILEKDIYTTSGVWDMEKVLLITLAPLFIPLANSCN